MRVGLFLSIAALGLLGFASAQSPERTFAGKVLLSSKAFPRSSKSAEQYIELLRKQSATNFYLGKGGKAYHVFFAAFFRGALDDVEVQVKIYDVSANPQKLISSFDQYLDERGQKSFVSSMNLDKKTYGVNKSLLITLSNHGKVLSTGKFKIFGAATKGGGKVDFRGG